MITKQTLHIDTRFSDLIGSVYEGAVESVPWSGFLAILREELSANVATLFLRPPSSEQQGVMVNDGGNPLEISAYNTAHYALDPFIDLPAGRVVSLHEYVDADQLQSSDFYRLVMKPSGLYDFLGADLTLSNDIKVRIRAGRYKGAQAFAEQEKQLLMALLPHIQRAVGLHFKLNTIASERALYAGAIEQLSVGSIILDEANRVLTCNGIAENLIANGDGLAVPGDKLQFSDAVKQEEFNHLLANLQQRQQGNEPLVAEAMTVARPSGLADLGLVLRPVPVDDWAAQAIPSTVIFVSDPEQQAEAPAVMITRLFGLTKTESALAMLLVNGLTLDEASAELAISRNTSRTHLRSVFSKTGVSRQTALVALILKSVATLG